MIGDLLSVNAHRPWALPAAPWVMTQQWADLLFAHWALPAETLRPFIPEALEIDTKEGAAWLGVVPFLMRNVRPHWLPALPWLSYFPELNLRTYVKVRDRGVIKQGVYFFSLEAANRLAVAIARARFHLPYFHATMRAEARGGRIHYRSQRTHGNAADAAFAGEYGPSGPVYRAAAGSLDEWLTERYALFTLNQAGKLMIGEIHHEPWPLQPATATIVTNTIAAAARLALPHRPPRLHFVRRLDVLVWPLCEVSG